MNEETMKQWEERMASREDKPTIEEQHPWNTMMKAALVQNIEKKHSCRTCKHTMSMEKNPMLVVTFPFEIFNENVPLVVFVCNNCGSLFAPHWSQEIIRDGVKRMKEVGV